MFTWVTYKNLWDLFLRECAKRREKETQISTTKITLMKTHTSQQTKHQLSYNINRHAIF